MSSATQVLAAPPRRRESAGRLRGIVTGVIVLLLLIWTLFPFYWAFISSIKNPADNYGNKWLPFVSFVPTLQPWRDLWSIREIRDSMVNSAVVSVGAATIAVVLGTLAAYGIARFRFHRDVINQSIRTGAVQGRAVAQRWPRPPGPWSAGTRSSSGGGPGGVPSPNGEPPSSSRPCGVSQSEVSGPWGMTCVGLMSAWTT